MFTSLDHLVIAVRDLDAATGRYAALLGGAPSWRGVHPGAGTANTLFRLERTYVELVAPAAPGPLAEQLRLDLDANGEGPYAIAFGTDDAAACVATLRARGIDATDPIDGSGRDRDTGVERTWRTVLLPASQTRGVRLFAIEHRSPADLLPMIEVDEPDAAVRTVDHAVIMTGDGDAACALYRDRLGLRLAFDRVFEARGLRLLFFRIGGITVELAAPLGGVHDSADRLWGISWRVANLDATQARLAAAGFDVSEIRVGHKPGTRVCTVRGDTYGVATLLIEKVAS